MAQAAYTFQQNGFAWKGSADALPGTPLTAYVRYVNFVPVVDLRDDAAPTVTIPATYVSTQSRAGYLWKLTLDV